MPFRKLVAACSLTLLALPAVAAIALAPGQDHAPLEGAVEHLEDPSRALTIEDVIRPELASRFVASKAGADLNFSYSSSAYWLRFSVRPEAGAQRRWLLEIGYPSLDRVEMFAPDGTGGFIRSETGDLKPFAGRPYPHRNLVLPVEFAAGTPQTVYLRVVSEGNLTVPVNLWTQEGLHRSDQRSYAVLALYYGALIALAAYNLLLFFSIRDRRYLEYVAFAASMVVGQASLNGLGNQFLWPHWPAWGNAVFPAGMAAAGLFGALFTRSFLETRRTAPGLDRAIRVWVVLFALGAAASFAAPYRLAAVAVSLTGLSFSVLAVACGVICSRRGFPGARYFLLAWTVLLLGVAVLAMRNFGWIATNGLTAHAMQIGSALEMLLLSFALADRINTMRREKDQAQAKALAAQRTMVETLQRNELELEQRVQQRTRELADANARLQESEQTMRHLAYHDSLTGLANRVLMDDRIGHGIERARRHDNLIAVLLVDLDSFKEINDRHGHSVGDEVLKRVAARLKECVRGSDTLARLGGDEFVVVLESLQAPEHASRVAKTILQALAEPIRVGEIEFDVSASLGMALYPDHGKDAESLLKQADKAMYRAKEAGRGTWRAPVERSQSTHSH